MRTGTGTVYKWVVDDVIAKVKPDFVQEGVDESVIDLLRSGWESRMAAQGLLLDEDQPRAAMVPGVPGFNPAAARPHNQALMALAAVGYKPLPQAQTQQAIAAAMAAAAASMPGNLAGMFGGMNPAAALAAFRPQPGVSAAAALQQLMRPQFPTGAVPRPPQLPAGMPAMAAPAPQPQYMVGMKRKHPGDGDVLQQTDGPADDGAVGAEDGGDADGTKDADAGEQEAQGDEILSSDDDDEDQEEETVENYLCCQFEKVTRTKNRWKISMREGVFHINGRDYLFKKANGEWIF